MQSGNKLILFIMDFNLLKRILPGEVIEYTTRNGVRATDGREFAQHRVFQISRNVMSSDTSCSVKLGSTHVLCSLKTHSESGSLLYNTSVNV